jgi:hypothetical protein
MPALPTTDTILLAPLRWLPSLLPASCSYMLSFFTACSLLSLPIPLSLDSFLPNLSPAHSPCAPLPPPCTPSGRTPRPGPFIAPYRAATAIRAALPLLGFSWCHVSCSSEFRCFSHLSLKKGPCPPPLSHKLYIYSYLLPLIHPQKTTKKRPSCDALFHASVRFLALFQPSMRLFHSFSLFFPALHPRFIPLFRETSHLSVHYSHHF